MLKGIAAVVSLGALMGCTGPATKATTRPPPADAAPLLADTRLSKGAPRPTLSLKGGPLADESGCTRHSWLSGIHLIRRYGRATPLWLSADGTYSLELPREGRCGNYPLELEWGVMQPSLRGPWRIEGDEVVLVSEYDQSEIERLRLSELRTASSLTLD